ncbi:hypothetical protein LTR66_004782 [Elasticomyces elasticus]|nr:hypothetical protein LTR66_004782 [Elasticomyces elasticus]
MGLHGIALSRTRAPDSGPRNFRGSKVFSTTTFVGIPCNTAMPSASYAVLGATGKTGQALLRVLSQSPDKEIHAYCRSKSRLLRLSPDLMSNPNLRVVEGNLKDVALIADCIAGTRAVFLTVAMSSNMPGCTIAIDTARIVVAAIERLHTKPPHLIMLSSASLDEKLCHDVPRPIHWLLLACVSHVYKDLVKAEEYLRSQGDSITTTFVKPGGLVHDAQKGRELSTERAQTFLSFLDLAAGMIEIADEDGDKWDMKSVSVLPTAKNVKIEWKAPIYLVKGLFFHFFPSLYPFPKS